MANANVIEFKNVEDGISAFVSQTEQGFIVRLFDVDSGNFLPSARIYDHQDAAIEYAKHIANLF